MAVSVFRFCGVGDARIYSTLQNEPLVRRMEEASKNERLTPLARIPSLDGLRGCAILLVLLFHFTARAPYPSDSASMRLQATFDLGWSGVDLFFVLSGFLITGLLIDAKGSAGYF
jgi:peptidoglycan/LPS O-acetylase OafA/YrhL